MRLAASVAFVAVLAARHVLAESAAPVSAASLVAYEKAFAAEAAVWEATTLTLAGEVSAAQLLEAIKDQTGLEAPLTSKMLERTKGVPVTVEFEDTSGEQVLDFLATTYGGRMVVDRKGKMAIVSPGEEDAVALSGWREWVLMSQAEGDAYSDEHGPWSDESLAADLRKLAAKSVTLDAKGTKLSEVLESLSKQSGLRVDFESASGAALGLCDAEVTLAVKARPLSETLDAITAALKIGWLASPGGAWVGPATWRELTLKERASEEVARQARNKAKDALFARKVNLHGDRMTLPNLAAKLEAALGVPCRMNADTWDAAWTWSFADEELRLSSVLERMSGDHAIHSCYQGGILWLFSERAE